MLNKRLHSAPATAEAIDVILTTKNIEAVTAYVALGSGRRATGVITLLDDLAAGEKVTIAGHDFVAKALNASGTATLNTVVAGNKLTIAGVDFSAKAKYAFATVACASVLEGHEVRINGVAFEAVAADPAGHQFAIGASDAESATNLAAAITAAAALVGCSAEATDDDVLITATAEGAAGNGIPLEKTGASLTLSGDSLSGAYDPALNEWTPDATDALAAANLAAAINACTAPELLGDVVATADGAVVTVTATEAGAGGNAITFTATGVPITVSAGGTLAGAFDAAQDEWAIMPTLQASADALAATIANSETAGVKDVVTATAAGVNVTVEAIEYGTDANAITLAKTGDHLEVPAGGTLAGGAATPRAVTVSVLDDDDSVLYAKTVSTLSCGAAGAVTAGPQAFGEDPVAVPIVLSRRTRITIPALDGTTAALVVFGKAEG